ncbi:hypothetical protein Tsubulata_004904 [Turnera subulata]|uniref:F-box domain-containing protein n=1 Tax=Turnera subulata TaxID=218843 RepID=A0A9Q0G3D0_9ROSI|nr:hypothetical protein Tsubulata_004904 [Turnera subulata]
MGKHISSRWADLPKELLEMIGKCLDSRVDVLRFRSVCTSWRATIPLPSFDQEIPPVILKLPRPISAESILSHTTICRLEILHQNPAASSPVLPSKPCWLTEVEETRRGQLQLLHPVSHQELVSRSPIELNLLDFHFVPVIKAFRVTWGNGVSVFGVNKVVLFPFSASCNKDEFGILAIYHGGKLGYWKYGDKEWTLLDDTNFEYDDIIAYKEQFYVVDRWGTVSWIDSALKVVQYSPSLYGCGGKKNLVESCGDLYVVDRYLDGRVKAVEDYENVVAAGRNNPYGASRYRKTFPKAFDFRVYRLDEDWGWVDVKSLGDRVFFLGNDCSFSVSSRDFYGGKGNCIYFTDDDNFTGARLSDASIGVFQLGEGIIEKPATLPEYCDIFWPPPLTSN